MFESPNTFARLLPACGGSGRGRAKGELPRARRRRGKMRKEGRKEGGRRKKKTKEGKIENWMLGG